MPIVPVSVRGTTFYGHTTRTIPRKTVNTEAVTIRLDSSWDGLDVVVFWKNSVIEEPVTRPLDDPAQPHTIPREVLSEIGDLRMGLVGLDGGGTVKPTIWLLYGYVVEGVDPDVGSGSQPPTPNYLQQMVEQATAAANAAKEAKEASEEAAKSAGAAGPYAEEAQKSAETAKEAQRAASTSAQEAGNARDQANTAANAAKEHADTAGAAKEAAERAAETAGNAQSGAAQSAQAAANSAQAAERAKQEAQKAASIFPQITPEDAGKILMVNPEGDGYIFGKLSKKRRLIAKYTHTANGVVKLSELDMETGVFTCSEPHKLSEGKPMYLRPLSGCNPVNIPVEIPLANPSQWGRGRLKAHIVDDYSFKLYKESSDDCLTYTSEYNSRVNVDFFTFEFDLKSVRISNINCNSIEIYACGDVSGGYFGSAFHLVGLQGSKEEIVRITEEDSAVKTGAFLDGQEGQVSKSLVFVGKATFKDDSIYAIFDYMSHVVALTSYAKQPSNSTPYIRRARASTSKTVGLTNYRMNRVPGEKVDIITGFSPCSQEAIPYNGFYIEVWGYDDDK